MRVARAKMEQGGDGKIFGEMGKKWGNRRIKLM
jgi:hypothetical protein